MLYCPFKKNKTKQCFSFLRNITCYRLFDWTKIDFEYRTNRRKSTSLELVIGVHHVRIIAEIVSPSGEYGIITWRRIVGTVCDGPKVWCPYFTYVLRHVESRGRCFRVRIARYGTCRPGDNACKRIYSNRTHIVPVDSPRYAFQYFVIFRRAVGYVERFVEIKHRNVPA